MKTDRKIKAALNSARSKTNNSKRRGNDIGKKPSRSVARTKTEKGQRPSFEEEARLVKEESIGSPQRLLATYEHAPIGIIENSLEGNYVNCNEEFCRITGYGKEELLTLGIKDLTYEEDYIFDIKLHQRLITGEIPFYKLEKRYVRKGGEIIWAEVTRSLVRDADGEPLYTIGAVLDVSERRQAEEQLRRTASFNKAVMSNMGEGLYTVDSKGLVTSMNSAAEKLFGWTFEELRGRKMHDVTHYKHTDGTPFPPEDCAGFQVLHNGQILVNFEDIFIRKDGTFFDVLYSSSPLWENGNISGLVVVFSEITERKRAEQGLTEFARQQEALYKLADQLHRTNSLQDVYNAALDAILSALQCDRASILLFDDTDVMRFVAWRGLSDRYRHVTEDHSPWKPDEKNPEPVWVNDIETAELSDSLKAVIKGEGIGSLAFIPLVSSGKLIGKFMAYFNLPHVFNEGELDLSLTIAHQLAFGIDRKQAEDALRESEERYRFIVENTSDGIWQTELTEPMPISLSEEKQLDWYYRYAVIRQCNLGLARMYGYSSTQEVIGLPLGIVMPRENPVNLELSRQFIRSGYRLVDAESREVGEGGRELVFLNNMVGIIEDGKLKGEWGTNRDITERKRAEEALRKSEERFRILANTVPSIVWIAAPDGTITYANDQWFRYVSITPEENATQWPEFVLHPDDYERCVREWTHALETVPDEYLIEVRNRRYDGQYRWFQTRATPTRDASGKVMGWYGVTTDIHDRIEAEKRLALLAEISELIRKFEDPNELLYAVSKVVGEHLQVRRCLFNETDLENDREIVHRDYYNGVESVAGVHKISDYSSITSAEMQAGKTVVNTDSKADARTAQDYERSYAPNGERAYVAIPLMRENRWVATLWVSDDLPRQWTKEEVSLLETIAERTWAATEKLRIDAALRASEALYRAIARSIPGGGVYVVDKDFRYLVAEGPVTEAFGLSREMLEGHTISEAFPTPAGVRMEERLRRNFAGETVSFETKYNGHVYWTQMAPLLDSIGHAVVVTIDITNQKQAEEALRQSEERFARFMQHLPGLAWIKDVQGRYVYANAAAEKAFSTPREKLYGKTDQDIFPPEVAAQFKKNDERALTDGKGVQVIETLEHDDGVLHYSLVSKFPIPGPDGNTALIGGTAFDITEYKRAEDALRESKERYQNLFDLVPVAVYTCDANGLIQEFNHRAAELWGREPEKNNPKEKFCGSFKMFYPDGRFMPHEACPMARILGGETLEPHELEILVERSDGVRKNVLAHPLTLKNERGEIIGAINCLYDITERKQAEEALQQLNLQLESKVQKRTARIQAINQALREEVAERRQAEELLRRWAHIFEYADWGIATVYQDTFAMVNPMYAKMHGYTAEELVSRSIYDVFAPESHTSVPEQIQIAHEKGHHVYESKHIRKDGSIFPVLVDTTVVRDGAGNVLYRAVNVQDITERKQVEQALHKSREHLRVLSRRLVEVQEDERRALARELHDRAGQTLAALNINLMIMNGQLLEDSKQRIGSRMADSMHLVAEAIALVRNVMTDLRPAVLDDYGLEAALQSYIDTYKSRYDIKVLLDPPEQPIPRLDPSVEMTLLRITQEALTNVARHAHADQANVSLRMADDAIHLTVQDNGVGIQSWPDANRPGSHGLKIMRERAEAFGGSVNVGSTPGEGTKVEARIPIGNGGQNQVQKEKR